jgi:hypothetical protein
MYVRDRIRVGEFGAVVPRSDPAEWDGGDPNFNKVFRFKAALLDHLGVPPGPGADALFRLAWLDACGCGMEAVVSRAERLMDIFAIKTFAAGAGVSNVKISDPGSFAYVSAAGVDSIASFPLFLIHAAWERGCSFDGEADGHGESAGTMSNDWAGIRDSSDAARNKMLEKAVNFLGLGA